MPVKTTIQVRRDTAANWTSTNPILASGEIGLETDTNKTKFGNGSSTWTALSYSASGLKVSDTAPTGATSGDMWLDSTTGKTYTYYDSFWVEQNGANSGKDGYSPAGNAIANGDFSKWSRGTSFSATNSGNYFADRWKAGYHDATPTTASVTQQAFTPGTAPVAGYESAFFIRSTITTVGSTTIYRPYQQNIEDVRTLAGQVATLSFWAKSDSARTQTVNIVQNFGSGGSADAPATTIPNTGNGYSFSTTTSWQRFSFYFQPQSIAGKTIGAGSYLYTFIQQAAASGSVLDLWGVQLEVGSVASPFRPAGGNTALDTATAGSAGFDGVLVSTNSASNPSGSGTPAWAGFDVAGKNKVINGGFDFWQRGTSFTTSGSVYTFYGADRWRFQRGNASAGLTVSRQSTGLTGFQYAARVQRDSGTITTYSHYIAQSLETIASIPLAGQTVTLSFYARAGASFSSASSVLLAQVTSGTGTDEHILNGYTGSAAVVYNNATLTTTWQRFSFTGTVSSAATELGLVLSYVPVGTAGANDYFEVTGIQLEAGSVATPFSRAGGTLQGELAACQRYYYRRTAGTYAYFGYGRANSTIAIEAAFKMPVTMRSTPTTVEANGTIAVYDGVTISNITLPANLGINSNQCNQDEMMLAISGTGYTQFRPYTLIANNNAASYIGVSAEL